MTPKVEELVARLRALAKKWGAAEGPQDGRLAIADEAAVSLTTLSARVMELEAALQTIAASPPLPWMDRVQLYEETARAALQPNPINEAAT